MKNILFTVLNCLFIAFSSCTNPGKKENNQSVLEINIDESSQNKAIIKKKISVLNENIDFLGEISSFDMIDESRFVVSTVNPSNIYIYYKEGNQVKNININGKGPFELLNPSIIKYYKNKIYIWGSNQLKLLTFDLNGNSINEHTGFKYAIKDFIIYKNYVLFYESGGPKEYISIYDLNKNKYIKKFGNASNEHLILDVYSCSGGMALWNDKLFYCSSDELSIHNININSLKESTLIKLKDPQFEINKYQGTVKNLINKDKNKLINYINNNSVIKGIHIYKNNILLIAEIGNYIMNENHMDYSNRYKKYYYIHKNNKKTETHISKVRPNNSCLFTVYKDQIYSIQMKKHNGEFKYYLFNISFNNSEKNKTD